jgi:hypothetical protein
MALTDAEKERVRYHLGYLGVQPAASIQYGLPKPIQTLFLVETAMSNIMAVSEERVRKILGILDDLEDKLVEAQDRLAADKLEELVLRRGEPDLLEAEYNRWAGRLADILGVPLYPYASRFREGGGNAVSNVKVRG